MLFVFLKKLASLAENVVLPDPCSPDINTIEGFPVRSISEESPPISWVNSSLTILIII